MKLALLAGLASLTLLSAAPERTAEELRVVHTAGSVVEFEVREWSTTEGREASMKINGEDAPEEMLEDLKASTPAEREDKLVRYTTWLDAVEDGRPVGARRRFDELSRTAVEGEEESEEEGELAGRTVVLTAEGDGDEVAAHLADGDEGPEVDDVYLKNHRLALELERYLPERPVEVGDTWDLDEAAVREILGIERDGPSYFESDASDEDEAMESAVREGVKVSGSVEYERREEVEGQSCAVLLISLRAEMDGIEIDPEALGMDEEGMEASATLSGLMEGEERLWFAVEAGRPVRSEAEWKGEMTFDVTMSNDDLGVEVEIGMTADLRGGFEHGWSLEEE